MKKKIIAFYNALLYLVICFPMLIIFVILFFYIFGNYRNFSISKDWYYILIYSLCITLPRVGYILIGYCEIGIDTIYFYYFPFSFSWDRATNNIDCTWNQECMISEIKKIEIVKLTKQEKRTKVYYKHIFNKYLKIDLKYGKTKFIYIGNYSDRQIKKIMSILRRI